MRGFIYFTSCKRSPMTRVYTDIECQDVNCSSRFSSLPPLLSTHNFSAHWMKKYDDRIFTFRLHAFFPSSRRIYLFLSLLFLRVKVCAYQAPGNRTFSVFHAGHTYPSTGFVLLGLNEILFLPCAAAKAKSREVCMCVRYF